MLGEGGRAAHFLFGGRHVRDLFDAGELTTIPGFAGAGHYLPVVSEPGEGEAWDGATGFVHTRLDTLPRALGEAKSAIERGDDVAGALAAAVARLREAGFDPIDYVALVDAVTLEPVQRMAGPARLIAAAKLGRTRLIDNLPVGG